jgi:hypothetical protein
MSKPIVSSPSTQPRKARNKGQRFASLRRECETPDTLLVIRTVAPRGKVTTDVYTLREIGTDAADGRAFSLTKPCGETYCCEVTPAGHTCDCKGSLSSGHCKHGESLSALLSNGLLNGWPEPLREEPEYTAEEIDAMAADFGYVGDAA